MIICIYDDYEFRYPEIHTDIFLYYDEENEADVFAIIYRADGEWEAAGLSHWSATEMLKPTGKFKPDVFTQELP